MQIIHIVHIVQILHTVQIVQLVQIVHIVHIVQILHIVKIVQNVKVVQIVHVSNMYINCICTMYLQISIFSSKEKQYAKDIHFYSIHFLNTRIYYLLIKQGIFINKTI